MIRHGGINKEQGIRNKVKYWILIFESPSLRKGRGRGWVKKTRPPLNPLLREEGKRPSLRKGRDKGMGYANYLVYLNGMNG